MGQLKFSFPATSFAKLPGCGSIELANGTQCPQCGQIQGLPDVEPLRPGSFQITCRDCGITIIRYDS